MPFFRKDAANKNERPDEWSVGDVGDWLDFCGLSEFKGAFADQFISGPDLLELTEADLIELGVRALGKRKQLRRCIDDLTKQFADEFGGVVEAGLEELTSTDSMFSRSGASSESSENLSFGSRDPNQVIKVKCYYRKDIRVFNVKPNTPYRKLLSQIREEYNRNLYLYYEDEEDDLIKIGSDRQLRSALQHVQKGVLKITLQRKKKGEKESTTSSGGKKRSSARESISILEPGESAMLESLVDGCVVISADGYVEFFNKAAEKIFNYSKNEVIGKNVSILMSGMYAARHDNYMQNYLVSGDAKIIGTTRTVLGRHKDGRNIALELSLSECKTKTRHTFTGMLKQVRDSGNSVDDFNFSVLDSLLEPVLCISNKGMVIHANPKSAEFFKYPVDQIVGNNISMLMPHPHRDNHNYYLMEYEKTGKTTVIGKNRDTVCELSDGSIKPIRLSVTENKLSNGQRQFIGTISERKAANRNISKLVQQRQVIDTLATPAIIIDDKGLIQAFNLSACKILGYTLDEVLGQNVSMVVGGGLASQHDSYLAAYLRTGVGKVIGKDRRLKARAKDGKELSILLTVTEHKDGEKTFFTGMFFHD